MKSEHLMNLYFIYTPLENWNGNGNGILRNTFIKIGSNYKRNNYKIVKLMDSCFLTAGWCSVSIMRKEFCDILIEWSQLQVSLAKKS